jgi:hypothetical protein
MMELKDIPAEMRWAIAAKSATAMAWAYGTAFQAVIAKKYFEISQQIWKEGGKEAKRLADTLGLPAGNAIEVDNSLGIISVILYGPEFKWDVIEDGEPRGLKAACV